MLGLIGKKIGMTSMFLPDGKNMACTIVEVGPNVVTQVKSNESDGYSAVQLAYGDAKEKNTTKPAAGHFKKAKSAPKQKLAEIKNFDKECNIGDTLSAADIFIEGEYVDVIGTSKGKGFQGVVKRHGFAGVGGATHGQHNRQRHPGSIGACSYPARVFKGTRMAGRTGGNRVKMQNLQVVSVMADKNLVVLSGAIPGANNSYVLIEK